MMPYDPTGARIARSTNDAVLPDNRGRTVAMLLLRLARYLSALAPRAAATLATVCAIGHASLLLSTATQTAIVPRTFIGSLVRDYEALTGADNTFSFFAPHVASQAFTEVTTLTRKGLRRVHRYERPGNEGELRVIAFSLAMQQQRLYDLLSYALATNALRSDDAVRATVKLGYYAVPSLFDVHAAPTVIVLYEGRYTREALGSS